MKTTIQDMNNQNKRILLVITKSNFGGAQKYVFELAKNLKIKGFEVKVVLGGDGILVQKLKEENIETISLPFLEKKVSALNDIKVFFTLFKVFRTHKPDIVHLNSSKIGGIGGLAARIARIPRIIFTIHGWAFNENRNPLSKYIIKIVYFITIFLSHASIAVSDAVKKQAASIPFSFCIQKKIYTIHNGVEVPKFFSKEAARTLVSQKINIDLADKKIVGQIAELHPIKSIETTIKAASQIISRDPHIIFIVLGEGEQRQYLEELIISLNLQNNFFLPGFLDHAAQYIKAFDVFCLTSLSEALGLVLLEAGLARVPIIASRVGGIPEIISQYKTGLLFTPKNTSELSHYIESLLSAPQEEIKNLTDTLYKKIEDEFLLSHMIEKTITLYIPTTFKK